MVPYLNGCPGLLISATTTGTKLRLLKQLEAVQDFFREQLLAEAEACAHKAVVRELCDSYTATLDQTDFAHILKCGTAERMSQSG